VPSTLESLTAADFLQSYHDMTTKTRNRLLALFILVFPFVVLLGFLISNFDNLPPVQPVPKSNGHQNTIPQGPGTGTNMVYSPR
jgi:hypothetical protein